MAPTVTAIINKRHPCISCKETCITGRFNNHNNPNPSLHVLSIRYITYKRLLLSLLYLILTLYCRFFIDESVLTYLERSNPFSFLVQKPVRNHFDK